MLLQKLLSSLLAATTHALLKVMHELFVAADCSQNIIRVLFADFSKAFDVIDHNVLLNKFISNNIPEHVIVWSLNFLNDRKQFVIIGNSVSVIVSLCNAFYHFNRCGCI